jgi:oxygen-independent coproporphyrinogen-3 oxidase
MSVGLYIHVPFCRARCHFCGFYLQVYREHRAQRYVKSLAAEIRLRRQLNSLGGRQLDSVYFGGGTPTTLAPHQLRGIFDLAVDAFGLRPDAEVTMEADPSTVNEEGLSRLRCAGFNRLSLGVQTMEQSELVRIGRRTVPDQVVEAVQYARRAGFESLNLDLMYGLPSQTLASWRSTLEEALVLQPSHLSCYALTVEEGTQLAAEVRRGDLGEPDEVLQSTMEEEAVKQLAAAGFRRYEISNFCRPGYECRHNLLYWTDQDYLGLGPSAQSYLDGERFGNVENLAHYHDALEASRLPITPREHLTPEQRRRESLIFGLRLTEGVEKARLGLSDQDSAWKHALNRLIRRGLLKEELGRLKLTDLGRRFADSVAVEIF